MIAEQLLKTIETTPEKNRELLVIDSKSNSLWVFKEYLGDNKFKCRAGSIYKVENIRWGYLDEIISYLLNDSIYSM